MRCHYTAGSHQLVGCILVSRSLKYTLSLKMTRLPNLPEEVLLEIFTRIPAKSVGRCRCLSKLWLANLSTSQFINLHLTRTKSHQEGNLLLLSHARTLRTIPLPITDEAVSKELSGLPQTWKMVLGSCNGLVLLLNDEDELFLVNPVTQEQVRVPHPPLPLNLENKRVRKMYGFGYDLSKDDYKILSLTSYVEMGSGYTFAHVYSLKMDVWRILPCDFCYEGACNGSDVASGAHVNGVIHWLTCKEDILVWYNNINPFVIATFNLADEAFGVIPFPPNGQCRVSPFLRLFVLRGCLLMTKLGFSEAERVVEAWIINEYGVHDQPWTNFSSGAELIKSKIPTLCFVGENEVMEFSEGSILLNNLKTKKWKTMVVKGHPSFGDPFDFVESLVSPSSFTLVAEEKNNGAESGNNTLIVYHSKMSHSLGGSLLLSNLGTQTMKSMVVNGAQPYFHDGRIFIESLVSPSSFTLIAEEKNDGTDFANNTLEAGPSQAPPGSSG